MRKFFSLMFITAIVVSPVAAQSSAFKRIERAASPTSIPNRGHAPNRPDGVGRLDLRVFDTSGKPVRGAAAHLTSERASGFVCESWASTDSHGVAVLPPLHVGRLTLIVKAAGYKPQTLSISPKELAQPVRITLLRQ